MVGRRAELARLEQLLAGSANSVVIGGASGVGKSRLGREALAVARRLGMAVAAIQGRRSTSGVPLAAFSPLLGDEAARSRSPSGLLAQAQVSLSGLTQGRSLVLHVDDAHLLDEASALLAEQLATARLAFVVATVESGWPAPESIVALWRDGLFERIELAPLNAETMSGIVSALLGAPVDPGTTARLLHLAAGNLNFLRELVLAARDHGALRHQGRCWRLIADVPLSAPLSELADAQLGSLTDEERATVELVALAGPMELAAAESIGGPLPLESLERKGTVTVERVERRTVVRLTEPLVSHVVSGTVPVMRERALKAMLAEWLTSTDCRRPDDRWRSALYRLDAGAPLTPAQLIVAARQARGRASVVAARRLTGAALEAGAGFEAALLHAEVEWLAGKGEHAEAELAQLAQLTQDDEQRAEVAAIRIDILMAGLGRSDQALAIADDVAASLCDASCRLAVSIARAEVLLLSGRVNAGLAVAEEVLRAASPAVLSRASAAVAYGLTRVGRPHDALEVVGSADCDRLALAAEARILALALTGRLAGAEEVATSQHGQAVLRRDRVAECRLAGSLAEVHVLQGRADRAVSWAVRSLALADEIGRRREQHVASCGLAVALAVSGDADEAGRALERAEISPETDPAGVCRVKRAQAWLAAARGCTVGAALLLGEVGYLAADHGDAATELFAWHDVARLGGGAEAAGPLAALSATTSAELIDIAAGHANALAGGQVEELTQASQQLEIAGARLAAAEAAAQGAVIVRRKGEPRRAAALERRATDLARLCPGAHTPALRDSSAQAALSARQLEIASLAARGEANKAIAQRLFLSVRTVETQLQRVYDKLGIDGRTKLRERLQNLEAPAMTGSSGGSQDG